MISLRYTCKIYLLCLDFFAFLNFAPIVILPRGDWFLVYSGHAIPTQPRPMTPNHQKL